jgi:predicted transcriptional regulator
LGIFFVAEGNSGGETMLDLFGQPVKTTQRGRGRPSHKRSRETVNRVILGLARGWTIAEVAQSIGITIPTLRQHYSSELRRRRAMRLMIESVQLSRLNDQAEKGNVTAEKQLTKMLERGRLEQIAVNVADRSKPKIEKLGKKEAAKAAAKGVKGKFAPPQAPLLN